MAGDGNMEDRLLTVKEVAERLGVTTSCVYQKCRTGIMRHIRIRHAIRIREKMLNKWLLDQEANGSLKILERRRERWGIRS